MKNLFLPLCIVALSIFGMSSLLAQTDVTFYGLGSADISKYYVQIPNPTTGQITSYEVSDDGVKEVPLGAWLMKQSFVSHNATEVLGYIIASKPPAFGNGKLAIPMNCNGSSSSGLSCKIRDVFEDDKGNLILSPVDGTEEFAKTLPPGAIPVEVHKAVDETKVYYYFQFVIAGKVTMLEYIPSIAIVTLLEEMPNTGDAVVASKLQGGYILFTQGMLVIDLDGEQIFTAVQYAGFSEIDGELFSGQSGTATRSEGGNWKITVAVESDDESDDWPDDFR